MRRRRFTGCKTKKTYNKKKVALGSTFLVMLFTGIFSLYRLGSEDSLLSALGAQIKYDLYHQVLKTYIPVVTYEKEDTLGDYSLVFMEEYFPVFRYARISDEKKVEQESYIDYEKIIAQEANDENYVNENGEFVGNEEEAIRENQLEQQNQALTENQVAHETINREKLNDFDYLTQNFYKVDMTTTITSAQLNAGELLAKNMKIDNACAGPKVLIYHTHSQEAFCDSDGTAATSVVALGDYLTSLLNNQYHIETLHYTGEFDKESRNHAYSLAKPVISQILKDNPSIQVVIDLHRDGLPEGMKFVTDINGKPTAKIMFFNGLSRTTANGDIAYLPNPYIMDNLAFSLQMQVAANEAFLDFTRKIYLKGLRYNLHLCPKSLLIEAGCQNNTFAEAKNAMEPLAYILSEVLL